MRRSAQDRGSRCVEGGLRVLRMHQTAEEPTPPRPSGRPWNPFRACGARAGGGKGRLRRSEIQRRWRQQSRMLPSHLIGRSPMSSTHSTRAQLTAAHSRHQINGRADNAAPHPITNDESRGISPHRDQTAFGGPCTSLSRDHGRGLPREPNPHRRRSIGWMRPALSLSLP